MTNNLDGVGPDRIVGHNPVLNDPGIMDVQFERAEPLRIQISDWVDLNLKIGEMVDVARMALIEGAAQASSAHRLAVRYLATRSRSEKEVRAYLLRKGVIPEICNQVIQRLGERDYLNDNRLASSYVQQAQTKMSRREMIWKLRQRGVSQQTVQQAVTSNVDPEGEFLAARKLASRYSRRFGARPMPLDWKKLAAFLQRKGFSTSVIMSVIRCLRTELKADEVSSND